MLVICRAILRRYVVHICMDCGGRARAAHSRARTPEEAMNTNGNACYSYLFSISIHVPTPGIIIMVPFCAAGFFENSSQQVSMNSTLREKKMKQLRNESQVRICFKNFLFSHKTYFYIDSQYLFIVSMKTV